MNDDIGKYFDTKLNAPKLEADVERLNDKITTLELKIEALASTVRSKNSLILNLDDLVKKVNLKLKKSIDRGRKKDHVIYNNKLRIDKLVADK